MRFAVTPVDELEREAQERQAKYAVWPKGTYDFEIISASEGLSKAGNSMITIEIRAYHPEGHSKDLKDYLVDSLQGKIHSLCKSIGNEKGYLAGTLEAHDLQGCAGKCRLGIEVSEWQGERRQKNKIAAYLSPDEVKQTAASGLAPRPGSAVLAAPVSGRTEEELDDEIPF